MISIPSRPTARERIAEFGFGDWDLPDPSGQPLETAREIRDEIATRVTALLAELR